MSHGSGPRGTCIRIGGAGYSIPQDCASARSSPGTRSASTRSSSTTPSIVCRPRTVFDRWRLTVPDGFRFAVKANREITHFRRLRDCAEPVGHSSTAPRGWVTSSDPFSSSFRPPCTPTRRCFAASWRLFPEDHSGSSSSATPSWQTAEAYDTLGSAGSGALRPGRGSGPTRPRHHRPLLLHAHAHRRPGPVVPSPRELACRGPAHSRAQQLRQGLLRVLQQ